MKIKEQISRYYQKKTKWAIISDVIFVALLIALIFPTSRKAVVSTIQKITLLPPSVTGSQPETQLPPATFEWTFRDMEGNIVKLKNFSHQVIFLNFWATWCPPCIAEMPSIQKLYDDYQDNVAFILISNESQQVIHQFTEDKGYTFNTYQNISQLPASLATTSIPTTFIISKEGKIVLKKTGGARWNSGAFRKQLDKLIAE
jgi:thiol-disulfide isomerase/thioredoxin